MQVLNGRAETQGAGREQLCWVSSAWVRGSGGTGFWLAHRQTQRSEPQDQPKGCWNRVGFNGAPRPRSPEGLLESGGVRLDLLASSEPTSVNGLHIPSVAWELRGRSTRAGASDAWAC